MDRRMDEPPKTTATPTIVNMMIWSRVERSIDPVDGPAAPASFWIAASLESEVDVESWAVDSPIKMESI